MQLADTYRQARDGGRELTHAVPRTRKNNLFGEKKLSSSNYQSLKNTYFIG